MYRYINICKRETQTHRGRDRENTKRDRKRDTERKKAKNSMSEIFSHGNSHAKYVVSEITFFFLKYSFIWNTND